MTPEQINEIASWPIGATYMRDVAFGRAAISGSDLKGRAAHYGSRYRTARQKVITRLALHGPVAIVRLRSGKLRLVCGDAATTAITFSNPRKTYLGQPLCEMPISVESAEMLARGFSDLAKVIAQ